MPEQLFHTSDADFTIESHGVKIRCLRLDIKRQTVYKIQFSSKRKPLIIARAKGKDRPYFWTSIPEGRQKEAEGIGELIELHLLQNK